MPAAFVLAHITLPLQEDALFWWVPKALWFLENGPGWVAAGDLPAACMPHLPLPPQWQGGLPDYGHPPTWYLYMAGWMAIMGPHAWVVRLACIPPLLLLGWSTVAVARTMAGERGIWAAGATLLAPPLLSQYLRPDTDLPLLCLSMAALLALLRGRPWTFAALAAAATWVKEPGVLLMAPALLAAHRDRRFLLAALAPLLALLAWGAIHLHVAGWALAEAERVPESLGSLARDLAEVARLVLLDQGRSLAWLGLLAGLALGWRAGAIKGVVGPGAVALGGYVLVQIMAFSAVNFLGGRDVQDSFTHVRYLLPAIATASLLALTAAPSLLSRCPPLSWRPHLAAPAVASVALVASIPGLRALHPAGPEANLHGRDLASAWTDVPAMLGGSDRPVFVESYLFTALTRPYAGLVATPMEGLRAFGPSTVPEDLKPGSQLLRASYGEPLGRLGELMLEERWRLERGEAWVAMDRVLPGRRAPPPSARPPR